MLPLVFSFCIYTDAHSETVEEDNDPEYNFMEDENKEDEWETRDDRAVKISSAFSFSVINFVEIYVTLTSTEIELSELMKDLFEGFDGEFVEDNVEPQPVVVELKPTQM